MQQPYIVKNFLEFSSKKEILYIIVNIIDICNYDCYYCYNIQPRTHKILNLDNLYDFVIWCYENLNKHIEVDILGGEPTLHVGLYNFCYNIRTNYNTIHCHITTNFSKPVDYIEQFLKLGVTINLSWHSLPNDRNNLQFIEKLKQIPKEYFDKKQIASIVMCEPDYIKQSFNAFDKIYSIYPENTCLGLIDNNHLTNHQKLTYKKDYLYTDDIKKEIEKRNTFQFKKNQEWLSLVYTYKDKELKYGPLDIQTHQELCDFYHYKCYAGINSIAIRYDGNITPCEDFYNGGCGCKSIGNINEKNYQKKSFHYVICNTHFCTCPYHTRKEKIF